MMQPRQFKNRLFLPPLSPIVTAAFMKMDQQMACMKAEVSDWQRRYDTVMTNLAVLALTSIAEVEEALRDSQGELVKLGAALQLDRPTLELHLKELLKAQQLHGFEIRYKCSLAAIVRKLAASPEIILDLNSATKCLGISRQGFNEFICYRLGLNEKNIFWFYAYLLRVDHLLMAIADGSHCPHEMLKRVLNHPNFRSFIQFKFGMPFEVLQQQLNNIPPAERQVLFNGYHNKMLVEMETMDFQILHQKLTVAQQQPAPTEEDLDMDVNAMEAMWDEFFASMEPTSPRLSQI